MNQRKIFPEREATTYPTNETNLKELRLAVVRPKSMKKGGKTNHLPVVVRSTREKDDRLRCQGSIYHRMELWYYVVCDIFLPWGYSFIFFYSRCIKEWFVAQ